jgi:hypothetical protein
MSPSTSTVRKALASNQLKPDEGEVPEVSNIHQQVIQVRELSRFLVFNFPGEQNDASASSGTLFS